MIQSRFRREVQGAAVIILLALALRAGVCAAFPDNLCEDRDGYLSLAQQVVGGHGYSSATTGKPTVFRPPLYPLLLAGLLACGGSAAIGAAQILLGLITVWLTIRIGRRLELGRGSLLAGALVAADPLLLQYTTFPMTETLCALLTMWLIYLLVAERCDPEQHARAVRNQLQIGLLFGLCTLCRPTFWAFGAIAILFWLVGIVTTRNTSQHNRSTLVRRYPISVLVGVLVAVAPWIVRNVVVLDRPIVTTTHGGYTLLLGNNPVFYRQEIDKPWGTVWEDAPPEESQEAWYAKLQSEWRAELGAEAGEVEVDRWMSRRAYRHIREEPFLFLRACAHRFLRFWGVAPQAPARGSLPTIVWLSVGVFYALVMWGFVLGIWSLARMPKRTQWAPVLLMIASFTLVHLVYWSNIRMRAPVVPLIALISAAGWGALAKRLRDSSEVPKPA